MQRTWAWNAERSEGAPLDAAAAASNHAIERHWTTEAGRRKQHLAVDRIPVLRDTVREPPARPVIVGDAGSGRTGLCVDI